MRAGPAWREPRSCRRPRRPRSRRFTSAPAGRVRLVSAAFLGLLNLLIAAVVRIAEAFHTGAGVWGVLSSLGRAASAVAADTNVTLAMIAISVLAIAALVALQRLLGSDEESFQ